MSQDTPLVQIGKATTGDAESSSSNGMSRRGFLKVLGASTAMGAVGCSDDTSHKALPNVFGQENQVPGVAVWYRSTCQECSAGCGITVRTREGRAVKIEGSREHPVNKGGLCGLGQSSLQGLYDPDRIRQPLMKKEDGTLAPVSWKQAIGTLTKALKYVKGDFAFITGEQSGSINKLTKDFVKTLGGSRTAYDPMEAVEVAKASEIVYGSYGVPTYRFDKAELVVNFGADFLETWGSPCEYARDWAKGRRGAHPTKVIHIEPRLSLTGANADKWLTSKPGGEVDFALFLLGTLVKKGKGKNLSDEVLGGIKKLTKGATVRKASNSSGVSEKDILLVAQRLADSKHSIVLSGGATGRTNDGMTLAVIVGLLNLVLGNVGDTVDISRMRKPESDRGALTNVLADMKSGKVKLALVANGTNPAFTLPSDYGFSYAVKDGRVKLLETLNKDNSAPDGLPFLVSFSSTLDETAKLADLILPSHHFLEDWGDAEPVSGVRSIVQPVMTPVFDTKSFGDVLLQTASGLKAELDSASGSDTFQAYVKNQWEASYDGSSFESWWLETVERGGDFSDPSEERVRVSVDKEALAEIKPNGAVKAKTEELILYPYFSVKSLDGRAANRPWLQELPDPIVQAVWDSWGEVHPDTAKKLGLKQGDAITVRNTYGELNMPVYVTKHVQKGIVAVPVGQGHSEYGRYAREVSHVGNVFNLLPSAKSASADLPLVSTGVTVSRALKKLDLVVSQGSDSQQGRHLARTKVVDPAADRHDDHHDDHGGHHHGETKQMYEQREHPLYEWVMTIDLAACTGCAACVSACFAENNIPVVGKEVVHQGREMSWLRIDRYFDEPHGDHGDDHGAEELQVSFMPMMCQHCNNAPCEPVCPVYATYHNEEGLNVMVYNRCVGTRYCGNNCSYKVRRFNWFEFEWPEPSNLQLNPDVTKRSAGVMEKCTFCVQRIQEAKEHAKDKGEVVSDGAVQPACVQSCPTQAMAFGNINDPESTVSKLSKHPRAYKVLDHHINTQPSVVYLENVKYKV